MTALGEWDDAPEVREPDRKEPAADDVLMYPNLGAFVEDYRLIGFSGG